MDPINKINKAVLVAIPNKMHCTFSIFLNSCAYYLVIAVPTIKTETLHDPCLTVLMYMQKSLNKLNAREMKWK